MATFNDTITCRTGFTGFRYVSLKQLAQWICHLIQLICSIVGRVGVRFLAKLIDVFYNGQFFIILRSSDVKSRRVDFGVVIPRPS